MHEVTETSFLIFFPPLSKSERKKAELKKTPVFANWNICLSVPKYKSLRCCSSRGPHVSLCKKLPCNTRCHCNKVKKFALKLASRCSVSHQAGRLWGASCSPPRAVWPAFTSQGCGSPSPVRWAATHTIFQQASDGRRSGSRADTWARNPAFNVKFVCRESLKGCTSQLG